MIKKFNEFYEFTADAMRAIEDLEQLAKNHLVDLLDIGFEIEVTKLNGADDSIFVHINKDGWFIGFGAKDQLLENCLLPFLELLRTKYDDVKFYFLEYRHSRSLEEVDIDFILSGDADFTMSEIYIGCKIL